MADSPSNNPPSSASDDLTLVENSDRSRFELLRGGELVSLADVTARGQVVSVTHMETPNVHRGQGYAGALMERLLDRLASEGRRVDPRCPFAARYMEAHPERAHLLA